MEKKKRFRHTSQIIKATPPFFHKKKDNYLVKCRRTQKKCIDENRNLLWRDDVEKGFYSPSSLHIDARFFTESVKCENDLQFEKHWVLELPPVCFRMRFLAVLQMQFSSLLFPPFAASQRGRAASAAAVVVGAMRLGAHFFWLVRSVQKGQVHFADEIVTRRNFLAQDFLDPHKPNSALNVITTLFETI